MKFGSLLTNQDDSWKVLRGDSAFVGLEIRMEEANKIMMDDNFNEVRVGLEKPFTFTLFFGDVGTFVRDNTTIIVGGVVFFQWWTNPSSSIWSHEAADSSEKPAKRKTGTPEDLGFCMVFFLKVRSLGLPNQGFVIDFLSFMKLVKPIVSKGSGKDYETSWGNTTLMNPWVISF